MAFTFNGPPRVVELATGRVLAELPVGPFPGIDIEWSPDGRYLATVDANALLVVFDGVTGGEVARAPDEHNGFRNAVTWSPDGRRLATGSTDGSATVWSVGPEAVQKVLTLSAASTRPAVNWVAFSPDGERLLTGSSDPPAVTTWDVGVGGDAEVASYPVDTEGYVGLDYTPAGDRLAIGTGSGEATLRDTATGAVVARMGPHAGLPADALRTTYSVDGWADSVAWSPDGRHLAAAAWGTPGRGSGGEVVVLDRTGRVVAHRTTVVGEGLTDVEFSPDGRLLAFASGSYEGYRDTPLDVELWDWRRDEVVRRVPVVGDATLAIHPDGDRIVVASGQRATVIDLDSGAEVAVLTGPSAPVVTVAYSPDGALIATGHEDGAVVLWDAETGRTVTVLRGQTTRIKTVVFSPDGRRVAASDTVATVRVSAVELGDLVEIARTQVTRGLTDEECRLYLEPEACPSPPG